jgi:hypothetical protein
MYQRLAVPAAMAARISSRQVRGGYQMKAPRKSPGQKPNYELPMPLDASGPVSSPRHVQAVGTTGHAQADAARSRVHQMLFAPLKARYP